MARAIATHARHHKHLHEDTSPALRVQRAITLKVMAVSAGREVPDGSTRDAEPAMRRRRGSG